MNWIQCKAHLSQSNDVGFFSFYGWLFVHGQNCVQFIIQSQWELRCFSQFFFLLSLIFFVIIIFTFDIPLWSYYYMFICWFRYFSGHKNIETENVFELFFARPMRSYVIMIFLLPWNCLPFKWVTHFRT